MQNKTKQKGNKHNDDQDDDDDDDEDDDDGDDDQDDDADAASTNDVFTSTPLLHLLPSCEFVHCPQSPRAAQQEHPQTSVHQKYYYFRCCC